MYQNEDNFFQVNVVLQCIKSVILYVNVVIVVFTVTNRTLICGSTSALDMKLLMKEREITLKSKIRKYKRT